MKQARRQTINIADLRKEDIGRYVEYNNGFGSEKGRIKSWNKEYVFVVYKCDEQWDKFMDYTGVATREQDLEFADGYDLR